MSPEPKHKNEEKNSSNLGSTDKVEKQISETNLANGLQNENEVVNHEPNKMFS